MWRILAENSLPTIINGSAYAIYRPARTNVCGQCRLNRDQKLQVLTTCLVCLKYVEACGAPSRVYVVKRLQIDARSVVCILIWPWARDAPGQ